MGQKSLKKGYGNSSRSRTKKARLMKEKYRIAREKAAKQATAQILMENAEGNNIRVIKIHNEDSDTQGVVQQIKVEALFIRDETNEKVITARGRRTPDRNAEEYNNDKVQIKKESDVLDLLQEIKMETMSTQDEIDEENSTTLCPKTPDRNACERNEEYDRIKTEEICVEDCSPEAPKISGSRNFNLYEVSKFVNMSLRHGRRCAAGELFIYNETRSNAANEITYKCSMCHCIFSIPIAD